MFGNSYLSLERQSRIIPLIFWPKISSSWAFTYDWFNLQSMHCVLQEKCSLKIWLVFMGLATARQEAWMARQSNRGLRLFALPVIFMAIFGLLRPPQVRNGQLWSARWPECSHRGRHNLPQKNLSVNWEARQSIEYVAKKNCNQKNNSYHSPLSSPFCSLFGPIALI